MFGSNPAATHCAGEIRVGSPAGLPSELIQGSLKVGSVIPKPKFSSSRVCFRSSPIFQVVAASRGGNIRSYAPVQKLTVLVLGGRRVGERIATRVIVELIFPDVGIHRDQSVRT